MNMRTLADLKRGEAASIQSFSEPELSLKLLEMGCLPGSVVRLEAVAPFGDPLCVILDGQYCLSLRKSEAKTVFVTTELAHIAEWSVE